MRREKNIIVFLLKFFVSDKLVFLQDFQSSSYCQFPPSLAPGTSHFLEREHFQQSDR